jgi:ADP-ribose pyrophosphatase YjhB (NUDIX family)
MEFGHTAEETLRKEIREEYGTEVLDFEFLGYRDVLRETPEGKTHWLALDFKARIDPTLVKIGEPDMIDELRWVMFDTLPKPLHSQLPKFFQTYRKQLERM